MKHTVISGLALFLLAAPANAQHAHFPLNIGDSWQYFQINPPVSDVQQTTVVGDTLMPNGLRYAVMSGWWWGSALMRQGGDTVYQWTPYGDRIVFDFSRAPGDTILSTRYYGDTVFIVTTVRDTELVFGSRRCIWNFSFDNPRFIDDEQTLRVVDSIGVTDMYFYGGPYNFQGARINGVFYGNFTGSSGQRFYPLQIGNTWSYRVFHSNYPNAPDSSASQRIVVKDVRMPNGKMYSQLNLPDAIGGQFIREDSNYVYYYSPDDTTEIPMYNLKTVGGATDPIRFGGFASSTVVSVMEYMVLGRMRTVREYSLGGLVFASVYLASGLGIIAAYDFGDGVWPYDDFWELRGAIIDDTLHGTLVAVEERETVPPAYSLDQNYPNPFNPSTTIGYALPQWSHVTLAVFNTLGQQVAILVNGEMDASYHEVLFDASGLASGVYIYRMTAGSLAQSRKMILVK